MTEEYSTDGDESHGDLTFEAAFLRHFRSGTTLSPGIGVIARFRPYRDRYDYDRYGPDGFRSKEERSRSIYSLSLVLSGGVRWFLSGEFAASVYTDLVAFTHSKESSEYTYYYPSSDEDETHGSDTSRTRDSVSFTMQPKVYLQYYF